MQKIEMFFLNIDFSSCNVYLCNIPVVSAVKKLLNRFLSTYFTKCVIRSVIYNSFDEQRIKLLSYLKITWNKSKYLACVPLFIFVVTCFKVIEISTQINMFANLCPFENSKSLCRVPQMSNIAIELYYYHHYHRLIPAP